MSWPEVAFLNAFTIGNDTTVENNTALELLLPQTHFVVRGSIPQRLQHCAGATLASDTSSRPELAFPNAFPLSNVPTANLNTGATLASDTFRG